MSYFPEALTIYSSGTIITAKTHPDINLKIVRYYQRIYYCADVNNPQHKNLVYYYHELNPPASQKI